MITFKDFPNPVLKKIVQNTFADLADKVVNEDAVIEQFIAAYHRINKQFAGKHPLTIRNLHMMALRYNILNKTLGNSDEAAALAIYDETAGLLNKKERREFAAWIKASLNVPDIKQIKGQLKAAQPDALSKDNKTLFNVTSNRKNPLRLFNHAFAIREKKITNPAVSKIGTPGILLEGTPGIGKSLLAVAYLESQGFVKAENNDGSIPANKTYYYLSTNNYEEMKALLEKAFHEGAVVIIDELNTLDIEPILNRLLSGRDFAGKLAENPGFFVIATQNPPSYSKRNLLSDALVNRFDKVNLTTYSREHLLALTQKPILVDEFIVARDYAKAYHLQPAPTPRDLFKHTRE